MPTVDVLSRLSATAGNGAEIAPSEWLRSILAQEEIIVRRSDTPFDNIESALEYVTYLLEACREARKQVEAEIAPMNDAQLARKKEALQLVSYKLDRLTAHIGSSEHLLKDLRKLRRLILEERATTAKAASA